MAWDTGLLVSDPGAGLCHGSADAILELTEVLDELDAELIGLKPVKARIRDIAALLLVERARRQVGLAGPPQPATGAGCRTGPGHRSPLGSSTTLPAAPAAANRYASSARSSPNRWLTTASGRIPVRASSSARSSIAGSEVTQDA